MGPFRFTGALRGTAVDYQAEDSLDPVEDPWTTASAAASAVVSAWGDQGALRQLLDVGLAGSLGTTGGEPVERVPEDAPPPDTVLGPVLDSTWISAGGVPLHVHVALPWVDGEWDPTGTLRLGLGAWHSTITAARVVQEGDTGRGAAVGRFDVASHERTSSSRRAAISSAAFRLSRGSTSGTAGSTISTRQSSSGTGRRSATSRRAGASPRVHRPSGRSIGRCRSCASSSSCSESASATRV